MARKIRIGLVAPACRLDPALAARATALAAKLAPVAELVIHPQCFLSDGHFAGPDAARADAFVEAANDPALDAIWFARGGYGSARIAQALDRLGPAARGKIFLGYSDMGSLLAGLYKRGHRVAHGPMPADLARAGGEAAFARSLRTLTGAPAAGDLEGGLAAGTPSVAFNLTILGHLLGTALEPDLSGHVLLIEEVSEAMYRIDRTLCQVVSTPSLRRIAGLRLGRCSAIPPNDPDFGRDEVSIAQEWCARAGVPYLGRADIGHDAENKIVPFGAHMVA